MFASLYYGVTNVYIGKSVGTPFLNGHKAHLHQKEIDFNVERCLELADDLVPPGFSITDVEPSGSAARVFICRCVTYIPHLWKYHTHRLFSNEVYKFCI